MEEKNKEEITEQERNEIDENGIKIADDVIATIAGKAASEVTGVSSMSGGFAGGRNCSSVRQRCSGNS
jgi:uncharacterized alkaline shock family protein YloU